MAGKTEKYASIDKPDRLEIIGRGFAKRVRDFGMAIAVKEPDYSTLEANMAKLKKPAEFSITFENDKFVAAVAVGSVVQTVASVDLVKEGDRVKRRALLKAINDHSELASNADLAAFDLKFPDPEKVKEAKAEVDRLGFEIKRDEEWKGKRPKSVHTMNSGEREMGFKNWAAGKTYERFLWFVIRVENGGVPADIAEEFVKTGAPSIIKLTDATRQAIEEALAKKQAPKLERALKEATAVVDARLLPSYNAEILKAITTRLVENKKKLVDAKAKYKAVGGK